MGNKCGQCSKPYSDLCEEQGYCSVHKAACFSCKLCGQPKITTAEAQAGEDQDEAELGQCSICLRRSQIEQLYFDYQCGVYICRFHFLKLDLTQEQTLLPCGDKQLTQDLKIYMVPFCGFCGRKLLPMSANEMSICTICQRKGFSPNKVQDCHNKKETPQKSEGGAQQERNTEQQHKYQLLFAQNKELKNQLLLLKQINKVSQFTRKQIRRGIYDHERDQDCQICLQPFNLTRNKPMMVCIQQHLVCQKCLKEQISLNRCPLCKDEINRQKILVSRQRLRTIQLEFIISQNYETKLHKCLEVQCKQIDLVDLAVKEQVQPRIQKMKEDDEEKGQKQAAPIEKQKTIAKRARPTNLKKPGSGIVRPLWIRRARPMAGRKRIEY